MLCGPFANGTAGCEWSSRDLSACTWSLKHFACDNYVNDPTNDMQIIEVCPLDEADGISLAAQLIEGEGIELPASATLARAVSEAAGHIPYYIHSLVAQMSGSKAQVTVASDPRSI